MSKHSNNIKKEHNERNKMPIIWAQKLKSIKVKRRQKIAFPARYDEFQHRKCEPRMPAKHKRFYKIPKQYIRFKLSNLFLSIWHAHKQLHRFSIKLRNRLECVPEFNKD